MPTSRSIYQRCTGVQVHMSLPARTFPSVLLHLPQCQTASQLVCKPFSLNISICSSSLFLITTLTRLFNCIQASIYQCVYAPLFASHAISIKLNFVRQKNPNTSYVIQICGYKCSSSVYTFYATVVYGKTERTKRGKQKRKEKHGRHSSSIIIHRHLQSHALKAPTLLGMLPSN